jgi:mRNA-degrading endonuclease RelE of RelBE toxin-antitoxin system
MSFSVTPLSSFSKEAKRLCKKYPSLKKELSDLYPQLQRNPQLGISIGKNCYKIRLAISSKGKGKSGGARVITCVLYFSKSIYLIAIYDKSERADISDKELLALVRMI